jgi:succinate dehydrogenase / fumarate reductase cytochrome b subunit
MAIKFSKTFLLRKLHQLTGIVPLGLFFFVHMFTNAAAMNGAALFNKKVQEIHDLPFLLFIEIFGIFLPLVFHSVYGVIIAAESKSNVMNYGYGRNWFYFMQRATGIFLFLFILFHLLHLRFGLIPGLTLKAVAGNADQAYSIISGDFQLTWLLIVYILGVLATAWHLAYGFFLFAVDWGLVIGENAQKWLLRGCLGLALGLSAVGVNAAVAFVRPCGLMPQIFCEEPKKASPSGSVKF